MSEQVAKSASRALGSVISKVQKCGGMPYNCFAQLFDTHVWSIINYDAGNGEQGHSAQLITYFILHI